MVGKAGLLGGLVAQETHRKDSAFSPRVPFPKKIEEKKATSNMPKECGRDPGRWQCEGNGSWPQLEFEVCVRAQPVDLSDFFIAVIK